MPALITDEQRMQLRKDIRFQDMVRTSAANYALFIHNLDGTAGQLAGLIPVEWAKQRFFIAESILQSPNSQDFDNWYAQYAMLAKGMQIWEGDVNATIDFMIANNSFEQLANMTFVLRAQNIKFS
jgi:hypothetical protein